MALAKINTYKKRNGDWMLYINDWRRINSYQKVKSVPVSEHVYTSKLTDAQKRMFNAVENAIGDINGIELENPDAKHEEVEFDTALGTVYITDVATVCGQSVGSDGAYLRRGNKLICIDDAIECEW